jgi:hypothetical protein
MLWPKWKEMGKIIDKNREIMAKLFGEKLKCSAQKSECDQNWGI